VRNNQKLNTVVLTAPPRYDLLPSSCVNNEVINFNRQLKKRLTPYNNVKILETDLGRGYFTKHGLHLNSSGKECVAQRLARAVGSFLNKQKVSPIGLYWKDDTSFPELNGYGSHTKTPQDPATSPNKKNENEVNNDHPQLT